MLYIRYESSTPNSRGACAGVFGLANGLARSGRLSAAEWLWWRSNNDWLDAAYTDPATVDPTLFDRTTHPMVTCWFKVTATHLLDRVDGYLELLERYDIVESDARLGTPVEYFTTTTSRSSSYPNRAFRRPEADRAGIVDRYVLPWVYWNVIHIGLDLRP